MTFAHCRSFGYYFAVSAFNGFAKVWLQLAASHAAIAVNCINLTVIVEKHGEVVDVSLFYNMLRKKLYAAQPNEGHKLIKSLEDSYDVVVVTQNVDNLHEKAGSSKSKRSKQ